MRYKKKETEQICPEYSDTLHLEGNAMKPTNVHDVKLKPERVDAIFVRQYRIPEKHK